MTRPSIQSLVRDDLVTREALGWQRYGAPLLPFNGRNGLQDLYEELLDACCYIKQCLIEQELSAGTTTTVGTTTSAGPLKPAR